jgi:hypothetical protein
LLHDEESRQAGYYESQDKSRYDSGSIHSVWSLFSSTHDPDRSHCQTEPRGYPSSSGGDPRF